MGVILLNSDNQRGSATHETIFRLVRTSLQIQRQTQLNSPSGSCDDTCDQTDGRTWWSDRRFARLKNRPIFSVLQVAFPYDVPYQKSVYILCQLRSGHSLFQAHLMMRKFQMPTMCKPQHTCLAMLLTRCSPSTESSVRFISISA